MYGAGGNGLMAPLSMAPVTAASWHTKSAPTRNSVTSSPAVQPTLFHRSLKLPNPSF